MVVMLQVMALDESCLACGPGEQDQGPVMSREARDEAFTRNYKRYDASLMAFEMIHIQQSGQNNTFTTTGCMMTYVG